MDTCQICHFLKSIAVPFIGAIFASTGSFIVAYSIFKRTQEKADKVRADDDDKKTKAKEEDRIEKLKGDIISVCDKLIRYSVTIEMNAICNRYYDMMVAKDFATEKEIEKFKYLMFEYHRKTEQAGAENNLIKMELLKCYYDFKRFWKNKDEVIEVEKLVKQFNSKGYRIFSEYAEIGNRNDLEIKYSKDMLESSDYTMKYGVGFELSKIIQIVDPNNPFYIV